MVTAAAYALPKEVGQKTILVGLGVRVKFLSHNVATNLHVEMITFPFERKGSTVTLEVILVLGTLCCETFAAHVQDTSLPGIAVSLAVDLFTRPRDLVGYQIPHQTLVHPLATEPSAILIASRIKHLS